MSMYKRNTVLVGAIALAFAGGTAIAGGPVGTVPFDGDGSGNGFTIDNAGFDFNEVENAPCPDGATCTNMTATTAGELLMREVDTGVNRFIQLIITSPDTGDGDVAYEASVSSGGDANAIAAKLTINQLGLVASDDFHSSQAMYRGAVFGASATNNNLAVENFQNIGNGFQTFDMETTASPNQGASLLRNGRIQILQAGGGGMQQFGHTILAGTFQTSSGTLTAGDESITFAAGEGISATWIGGAMVGGGPGVILADGQEQNHDTRTAAQRDFGLLIYRTNNNANSPGAGNAGGTPNGLVEPQFTQAATAQEARGFSGPDPDLQDSGLMYNLDHGTFEGGAAILADGWDADVFGPNPY
jgi:hypothetical protein